MSSAGSDELRGGRLNFDEGEKLTEVSPDWQPLAHVAHDGRVDRLVEHLRRIAKLAEQFAGDFGCSGWGYLAGLWHDLRRGLKHVEPEVPRRGGGVAPTRGGVA